MLFSLGNTFPDNHDHVFAQPIRDFLIYNRKQWEQWIKCKFAMLNLGVKGVSLARDTIRKISALIYDRP